MIKQDITIINKLGLHARAASKLVNLCSQYGSSVFLDNKGNRVNAKSIMGVMMLAASKGTEMILEIDGEEIDTLIHEMQHDPVKDTVTHIDFYAIERGKSRICCTPLSYSIHIS